MKEPVPGDRQARASQDNSAAESELKVTRRLEADLFAMHEGTWRCLVALECPEKCIPSHGAQKSEQARQPKRCDSIEMDHSDRIGIVAVEERPGLVGRPPLAFLAVGNLPIREIYPHVSIQEPCLRASTNRSGWG